jgi:hypothetical protein
MFMRFLWFFTIRIFGSWDSDLSSLTSSSNNLNLLNFAFDSNNSDRIIVALSVAIF